jgi:hypothetical protein
MSFELTHEVIRHATGPGPGRLLLVIIADCVNKGDGYAWPSLQYLVARSGYSRRTVVEHLARLREVGALKVTQRPGRPNHYVIGDVTRAGTARVHTTAGGQELHGGGAGAAPEQGKNQEENPDAPAARRRFAAAKRRGGRSLRSRGAGSSAPPTPHTEPPDETRRAGSRVPTLIGTFVRLHHEKLGQPYPPAWARDGACLKRALQTWEPADIERAMTMYFDDRDARLQFGADVPAFVKRVPTLLARDRADTCRGFVG